MFRLKDDDGNFLGQPLIAFIKVKPDPYSNSSDNSNSSITYSSKISIRKSSLDDDFSKFNLSDEQLLGMASLLFDEGFGSFDRCYGLIRVLKGDLKKAKDILSQLIFYEC